MTSKFNRREYLTRIIGASAGLGLVDASFVASSTTPLVPPGVTLGRSGVSTSVS